jgi:predicted ferric reductase
LSRIRVVLAWAALAVAILLPVVIAARSPLLAWRDGVYIAAGFAGIVGLALLLVQPLLAGSYLPGLAPRRARQVHRWLGGALVALVVAHVAGLWLTSAPDVIDALLFDSPTPFSPWGVVAMWAVFATALLAAFRRRLGLSPAAWRIGHTALALVIVVGTIVHALLIDGAMGTVSKAAFCLLVAAATTRLAYDLAVWMRA